ncbi:hypothetical protein AKJ16_DCAP00135 [Drosera capensis]
MNSEFFCFRLEMGKRHGRKKDVGCAGAFMQNFFPGTFFLVSQNYGKEITRDNIVLNFLTVAWSDSFAGLDLKLDLQSKNPGAQGEWEPGDM